MEQVTQPKTVFVDVRDRLKGANPFSFVGTLASDALQLIKELECNNDSLLEANEQLEEQAAFYRRNYEAQIAIVEVARRLFEEETRKAYRLEKALEKIHEETEAKDGSDQAC